MIGMDTIRYLRMAINFDENIIIISNENKVLKLKFD